MKIRTALQISFFAVTLCSVAFLSGCSGTATTDRIPVRVVVVTMYEIGEDEGEKAGEFQLWKERQQLHTQFEIPSAYHDVFMNEETGVMGMVTGIGTTHFEPRRDAL